MSRTKHVSEHGMADQSQFPKEQSETGEFERQEDAFRHPLAEPPTNGRYHLYVSLACPWASRALIVRNLNGLQDAIGVTVADPVRDERGWAFRDGPGFSHDPVNGFRFLSEAYKATDPGFDDRVTVPVLWDNQTRKILNNNEDDICRMFCTEFAPLAPLAAHPVDLFPKEIAGEQAELSAFLYETVNNGVYRAGFATSQEVYERACRTLFQSLDTLEERLATRRYLFGKQIVESDWRLFCTLIRFDAVYYTHFKCNLRRILDYPNLQGYLMDLYQQPGIAETVSFDQIKRHYYLTHDEINPTRLVPIGPLLDLTLPHGREFL